MTLFILVTWCSLEGSPPQVGVSKHPVDDAAQCTKTGSSLLRFTLYPQLMARIALLLEEPVCQNTRAKCFSGVVCLEDALS